MPQAFLEQYANVRHPVTVGVDAERTELPYVAVGGMNMIATALFLLGRGRSRGTRSMVPAVISPRTGGLWTPSQRGSSSALRQPSGITSTGPLSFRSRRALRVNPRDEGF